LSSFLQRLKIARLVHPAPEPVVIEIDGQLLNLRFRRNAAARRLVLRLDQKNKGLVMTLPQRAGLVEAMAFAEKSRIWISNTLAKQPLPATFGDGVNLLFRGREYKVRLTGAARGVVQVTDHEIRVPGNPEHAQRRMRDYLREEAKRELTLRSRHYAQAMSTKFSRIAIRDQKSRWGSCSSAGVLSYSWRLILTPDYVCDYVAAHEVAHLREMNHGPRFWRLVLTHCPHAKLAKQWLKRHGKDVHSVL